MTTALLAAFYLALLLGRSALAHHEAGRSSRRTHEPSARARGDRTLAHADIAVLQPILSGDPALPDVLATTLDALPEALHVVWLVDEDDAAARALTDALASARPGRRITRLVLPPPAPRTNPKTVKLAAGARATDAPVLVVLDDDARLERSALDALVGALDRGALATALPWYEDVGTVPGALLARFVNDHAALTYLAPLALVEPVSINGMAYALRRETLEAIGGFEPLAPHLTDDLALALALRERDLAIVQTSAPVRMHTSLADLGAYVRLMHRWYLFATLLLAAHGTRVRLLAAVLQGLPPLLLWGVLGTALAQPSFVALASVVAVIAIRSAVLARLHHRFVPGRCRPRPLASLLVELLQPIHLVHALAVREIRWRTRRYRVRAVDDFVAL